MKVILLENIRKIGSKNIGATNVLRTGNKSIAILTLLLDILKGMTVDRAKVRYGVNIFKKKVTAAKDKFKLAADIAQEVGIGPREFQNILQSLKILPESYGIGTIEYAKHAFELTPGQSIKNYKKITNQVSKKDIKEWADEESTIDKYKERYKRSWKAELKKSVERMLDEI